MPAGVVLGGQEVAQAAAGRLHQQDAGAGGDGVGPLHVEADLERPPAVGPGVGGAAGLVDLREATVRRRAGRETVLGAEGAEIGLGARVVVGVDDGDGLAGPGRRARREAVGRLQGGR